MVAYIKGTVEQITEQSVIMDNNGIGYIINTSASTISRLPGTGETAIIFTHMQVKEDDISLYGFSSREEIRLFQLFISISGIGPKVAMAILGTLSAEQIYIAIAGQDAAAFSKVPGVGKKTAQRITLELQDKVELKESDISVRDMFAGAASSEKQDAIEALLALGYSRSETMKAVLSVAADDMKTEQIIRLALKKFSE